MAPSAACWCSFPFSILIGGASRLTGRLAGRIGPRWPLTLGPIVAGAGFVLLLRAGPDASYWTGILPGVAVIALGVAGSAAPLTTAVLSSVDANHTGTASGFNSAVARTGGLLCTALAGAVIVQAGSGLTPAFHMAAIVAALMAIAAGATAFATLKS